MTMRVRWFVLAGSLAVVGLIVLIFGVRGTLSDKPPPQIFPDMKLQPKYHAQGENHFFPDRRDMRTPVVGTVAYDGRRYGADAGHPVRDPEFLQADELYFRGTTGVSDEGVNSAAAIAGGIGKAALEQGKPQAWVTRIPAMLADGKEGPRWAVLEETDLKRGQEVFNMTCALCHGQLGNGKGVTTLYQGMVPANLHDPLIREQPVGQIFNTITNGTKTMKGYGHMIRPADRWKVVAYVRALQRSQNPKDGDIPPEQKAELDRKK